MSGCPITFVTFATVTQAEAHAIAESVADDPDDEKPLAWKQAQLEQLAASHTERQLAVTKVQAALEVRVEAISVCCLSSRLNTAIKHAATECRMQACCH
jgi:hypothetical protein